MATDNESFNRDLYDLLKVRGYEPVPLDSKNQRVPASQAADVIQFTFTKDGKDYGKAWVSIDDAQNVIVYYDEEQQESPSNTTPGVEYDDSWTGFLKHLKQWAQRRQLSFELSNKDRLGDDMRQRDYYKMKERLGESAKVNEVSKNLLKNKYLSKARDDLSSAQAHDYRYHNGTGNPNDEDLEQDAKDYRRAEKREKGIAMARSKINKKGTAKVKATDISESYHPMGKKASYNDAVPNVKIILQHNRALEEGEQRYRNVAKIFLENQEGERFLAPTTRPGIARVYARHIAEGGVPNDDKWNHIKSICEDYNKMAGFVRATRNGQFNESAAQLVQEGINHYNGLRETLHKLTSHRGYQNYFESWTPTLMEDELDESINELFVQEMVDPRIESAMPILSRLKKPVTEMSEVDSLAEWADSVINEKLELDDDDVNENFIGMSPQAVAEEVEEGVADTIKKGVKNLKRGMKGWEKGMHDVETVKSATKTLSPDSKEKILKSKVTKGSPAELQQKLIKREKNKKVDEAELSEGPFKGVGKMMMKRKLSKGIEKDMDKTYGALEKMFDKDFSDEERFGDEADFVTSFSGSERKRKALDRLSREKATEDLDANQKRVGQLGPTEKVRNNNIGKLVGASESTEIDPELARIMEMARFKR